MLLALKLGVLSNWLDRLSGECLMPVHIIERAFQLAPDCTSVDEIRQKLKKEGFASVEDHLAGGSIQKELKARLRRQS